MVVVAVDWMKGLIGQNHHHFHDIRVLNQSFRNPRCCRGTVHLKKQRIDNVQFWNGHRHGRKELPIYKQIMTGM